ncbi:MAG: bifunctional phosphoribosylaminoimidazolecarboxamide formyltransferase/IMP cyclohydrolase [Burkholderiales bacterium]
MPVKRALLSVADKTGIADFARGIQRCGLPILSTGGTATALRQAGVEVEEVAHYTGFPEILDGRVKTLHPKIHAGILARRDLDDHLAALRQHGIDAIDLVAINLYPFQATVAQPSCTLNQAIENIDVGGAAMLRAAAKNHAHVTVITDPGDYASIISELESHHGQTRPETRLELALKAFAHCAGYDAAISRYLHGVAHPEAMPDSLLIEFSRAQNLRYGENPHQNGAFYREHPLPAGCIGAFVQLQGKELSYNNIADADAAWECVKTFPGPACVIVKHANPCGVAQASDGLSCYRHAFATDPSSAFGGIIAFNRPLDGAAATAVTEQFVEVLIAPDFTSEAREVLARKPNIRVLKLPMGQSGNALDYKRVGGGLLVQTPDALNIDAADLKVVTTRQPSEQLSDDLLFAWRVAKFGKSNAIVFAANGRTLGIGAGQMSRVDSARIAAMKAREAGLDLTGSVVASDAFFPFRDGLDVVAESGAVAAIQPGGSVRDDEVIAAANERGMVMIVTGVRHFRH